MRAVKRLARCVLGFALGVAFGVVLAAVMPLAMAGEAWRGDEE